MQSDLKRNIVRNVPDVRQLNGQYAAVAREVQSTELLSCIRKSLYTGTAISPAQARMASQNWMIGNLSPTKGELPLNTTRKLQHQFL